MEKFMDEIFMRNGIVKVSLANIFLDRWRELYENETLKVSMKLESVYRVFSAKSRLHEPVIIEFY